MKQYQNDVIEDVSNFDQLEQNEFLNIPYDEQVKIKNEHIKDVFLKQHISNEINPMIIANKPTHYRHKVTVSATNVKTNHKLQIKFGFFIEKTHQIKPKFESILHDQTIEKVLRDVENILQKRRFTAYVKGHNRGIIKHVLIRKSYTTNDLLVVIVTKGHSFPNHKEIIRETIKLNPNVKTVVQMIQNTETPIVLYGEEKVLFGKGYIEDSISDLRFKLSAKSFYQVNPKQMMVLYDKAFELANIKKTDHVMDCYSGIGTLSLLAAKKAQSVTAIEINASAVKDAIDNAKRNHMTNIQFIRDDVETYMKNYQGTIDVLMMDPPRIGASLQFIEAVKKLKPKRIVYISCFLETQVRDIRQLFSMYDIKAIQPVDMFPYTTHVETITLLSLKTV